MLAAALPGASSAAERDLVPCTPENKTFALEHFTLLLAHHDTITAADHPGFDTFLEKYYEHLDKHGILPHEEPQDEAQPATQADAQPATEALAEEDDSAQPNATEGTLQGGDAEQETGAPVEEEEDSGRRVGQKIISMLHHATGLDAVALKRLEVRKGSAYRPAAPRSLALPRSAKRTRETWGLSPTRW